MLIEQIGHRFWLDRRAMEARAAELAARQRRRVALARALVRIRVGGARLLILDEPTAGLDAATEARVVDAVRATGAGALIVSHRAAVLAAADRVVSVAAMEVAG